MKYNFSISVFDKPKDLKEKISEICNKPDYKSDRYCIRLKDKESYIYGDEILLDFEPIHNALIRGQKVKLKCKKRDNKEKSTHQIKFWAYDKGFEHLNKQRNLKRRINPESHDKLYSGEIEDQFSIKLVSVSNMYKPINLLLKEENYKTLCNLFQLNLHFIVKNKQIYCCKENISMLSRTSQTK